MNPASDTLIRLLDFITEELTAAGSILRATGKYGEDSFPTVKLDEIYEAISDLHTWLIDDNAPAEDGESHRKETEPSVPSP